MCSCSDVWVPYCCFPSVLLCLRVSSLGRRVCIWSPCPMCIELVFSRLLCHAGLPCRISQPVSAAFIVLQFSPGDAKTLDQRVAQPSNSEISLFNPIEFCQLQHIIPCHGQCTASSTKPTKHLCEQTQGVPLALLHLCRAAQYSS